MKRIEIYFSRHLFSRYLILKSIFQRKLETFLPIAGSCCTDNPFLFPPPSLITGPATHQFLNVSSPCTPSTLSLASTSALALTSSWTEPSCPSNAALCRGVRLSCSGGELRKKSINPVTTNTQTLYSSNYPNARCVCFTADSGIICAMTKTRVKTVKTEQTCVRHIFVSLYYKERCTYDFKKFLNLRNHHILVYLIELFSYSICLHHQQIHHLLILHCYEIRFR
jgi:hypothetical protein